MTLGRIIFDDHAAPSSGYRFAAMAALIETFSLPNSPALTVIIPGKANSQDDVHDRQHVTPEGQVAPNGVVWLERAGATVVLDPTAEFASLDLGKGERVHAQVTWSSQSSFAIVFDHPSPARATFALDEYGRPILREDTGLAAMLGAVRHRQGSVSSPSCTIAILAQPRGATWIYPAVRAALGDAADVADCRASIEVVPPPANPADAGDPTIWQDFDGVVLPGGADMDRTSALMAAAAACRLADIPTLGLCLGMQAMCIAAAREVPQLRGAAMEEIEPQAPLLLFTRLPASDGCRRPRLGDRTVTVASDSKLAGTLGRIGAASTWAERMNHSFRLEPSLLSTFAASGLSVISKDSASEVVDIIEDPAKTFYVGAEGHPELASRRSAPHPIIHAFLWSVMASGHGGSKLEDGRG